MKEGYLRIKGGYLRIKEGHLRAGKRTQKEVPRKVSTRIQKMKIRKAERKMVR